jgi:hypothetical protein
MEAMPMEFAAGEKGRRHGAPPAARHAAKVQERFFASSQ